MNKTIIFILILLFTYVNISCQNEVLVLIKKKNNKEKTIQQGKKIKVYTKDDNVIKGKLTFENDSQLYVNEELIDIYDIKSINKTSLCMKIAGSGLTTIGGGFATLFGIGIVQTITEGGFTYLITMILIPPTVAAILVAGTGVVFMVAGKTYKSEK